MSAGSPKGRDRGAGYVLISVLSVMLLLSGLAAAGSVFVRSALRSARIDDGDAAMAGLTRGGLEITAYELFNLKLPVRMVHQRRVRFGGAMIVPSVTDEAGKVDLNGADPRLLQSLFVSVGIDSGAAAAMVTRILAFRGDTLQSAGQIRATPHSQELQTPGSPLPQTQRARRGFQSVQQLLDVAELSRGDARALLPRLTVFNPDGKVDILAASEEVLTALPGLTPPKVADILSHRDRADAATIEGFKSMLGEAAAFTKTEAGPAFRVMVDVATTTGRRRSIEAVIAASKSLNDPFYILDWLE